MDFGKSESSSSIPASSSKVGTRSLSQWTYTSRKSISFEGVLVLDNYSALKGSGHSGKYLGKADFYIPNCPEIKWRVSVLHYHGCEAKSTEERIKVVIRRYEGGQQYLWTKATISLVDSDNQKCPRRELTPTSIKSSSKRGQFAALAAKKNDVCKVLSDDKLNIAFEILLEEDAVSVYADADESPERNFDLDKNLEKMLTEQAMTDVVLTVDGHNFPAHKSILAARSPVFAAMFASNLSESVDGMVTITDVPKDVFEIVLKFIYTDHASNIKGIAASVLAAAEKYDLQKLKAFAQTELCSDLSDENVSDVLIVADMYRAPYLKKLALQYVASNAKKVIMTHGWRTLVQNYPKLSAEAFEYFVVKQ